MMGRPHASCTFLVYDHSLFSDCLNSLFARNLLFYWSFSWITKLLLLVRRRNLVFLFSSQVHHIWTSLHADWLQGLWSKKVLFWRTYKLEQVFELRHSLSQQNSLKAIFYGFKIEFCQNSMRVILWCRRNFLLFSSDRSCAQLFLALWVQALHP